MAQLVRAPPCHGGGREFESLLGRLYGIIAQLGEHLPYKQRVIGSSPIGPIKLNNMDGFPSGQKGTDCKSAANCFGGSNPPPSISRKALADVAQLAEQLICNQQVIGSSPIIGFKSQDLI